MTHICISNHDNGLSPGRPQAIIWTSAGILLIGPLRANFNKILIEIRTFSFKKMHLKSLSAKWQTFCLGLNVLTYITLFSIVSVDDLGTGIDQPSAAMMLMLQGTHVVALLGLALLTLSWDKNWDSHSPMNGYPSFYPRIAFIAPSPGLQILTHSGRDKMATIFQTTFPNTFSWMKMYQLQLIFHWSLFPRV